MNDTGSKAERPGPQRTCIGCGLRRSQHDLLRFALLDAAEGGEVTLIASRQAHGRGGWICASSLESCFDLASQRRGWAKAFRRAVPLGAIEACRSGLSSSGKN